VVVAAIFVYIIWSVQPAGDAKVYLPQDVTAYIEWSGSRYFDNQVLGDWKIVDQNQLDIQWDKIKGIFGDKFSRVEQVIIFGTNNSAATDNILVSFGRLSAKNIQEIQSNIPEYTLRQLDKHTLLISKANNTSMVSEESDKTDEIIDTGINIYWHNGYKPEYVLLDSQFFSDQSIGPRVNISLARDDEHQNNILSIYGPLDTKSDHNFVDFLGAQAPDDTKQVTILQSKNIKLLTSVVNYILGGVHNTIPDISFGDAGIIQTDKGWLLVGKSDWKSTARTLSSSFELREVNNTLPDGTRYVEYVADDNIKASELQVLGKTYWQVDEFFGAEQDNYFYLSNSEEMVEQILMKKQTLGDQLISCQRSGEVYGDWFSWKKGELQSGPIKDIFVEQDLERVIGLSFVTEDTQGLRVCF